MKTDTLDRYLRDLEFFKGLPDPDLELIAGCGRNVHFRPGEYLAREDDAADYFFVLREGRVALELHVPNRGQLVIDTVGPGEILGVSWLFPPYRWGFDARAVDATAAVWLDGACLRGKCDDDPRLGYELMRRFAHVLKGRLQSARIRLLDLYGHGSVD